METVFGFKIWVVWDRVCRGGSWFSRQLTTGGQNHLRSAYRKSSLNVYWHHAALWVRKNDNGHRLASTPEVLRYRRQEQAGQSTTRVQRFYRDEQTGGIGVRSAFVDP